MDIGGTEEAPETPEGIDTDTEFGGEWEDIEV